MWQPIETAPKDGSSILLSTPKGRIADGFWHVPYKVWSWPYVMVEPTHWMPLPDAPGAQAQPAPSVSEGTHVQPVPDHCDRITWRGSYYHLPPQPAQSVRLIAAARKVLEAADAHGVIQLDESGVVAGELRAALAATNPDAQAQPAPSVNEGVRKVTLGFRWESEAQHHIPTIEIEFDPVSPESSSDAKGWQDRDRIASRLSPESKP